MRKHKKETKRIETAFERGTRAVEEIHRSISDLPFAILERIGILEHAGDELKRIHDDSVAAVYNTIRDVGHKVVQLAVDLDEDLAGGAESARKEVAKAV